MHICWVHADEVHVCVRMTISAKTLWYFVSKTPQLIGLLVRVERFELDVIAQTSAFNGQSQKQTLLIQSQEPKSLQVVL